MSGCSQYEANKRGQSTPSVLRQPLDYGSARAAVFTSSDDFRIKNYLLVIDRIVLSFNEKIEAYKER